MESFVVFICFLVTATYSATSGLYGLASFHGNNVTFNRIDLKTNRIEVISTLPFHISNVHSSSSIDNKLGLYYFVNYDTKDYTSMLVALSLDNGTVVNTVVFPKTDRFNAFLCDVDHNTGDVVVVGIDQSSLSVVTVFVNVTTKSVKRIYSSDRKFQLPNGNIASAYDYVNKIGYFSVDCSCGKVFATPEVLGVNVSAGALVSETVGSYERDIQTFNFDPKTGLLFGFGMNFNSTTPNIAETFFFEFNGTVKSYRTKTVYKTYSQYSNSALDIQGRRSIVFINGKLNVEVLIVNVDTGVQISLSKLPCDWEHCPTMIEYYSAQ